MALCSLRKKIDFVIAGICPMTDAYPNAKYKVDILRNLENFEYSEVLFDLSVTDSYWAAFNSKKILTRTVLGIKILTFTFIAFFQILSKKANLVYVLYPSLPLTILLSLVPRRYRPKIIIDGFISIYDTVVCDRAIYPLESIKAKILFRLERRSFSLASRILVDTGQNASYYATLFNLEKNLFSVVPLSIPNLKPIVYADTTDPIKTLRVVFLGTLIPLHGVDIILKAAKQLMSEDWIEFHVVGDGQESHKVETAIDEGIDNIQWHRGFYNTEEIVNKINYCHVAAGVFSKNAKTNRVIPYKHYYYMKLGRPVITAKTDAINSLKNVSIENGGAMKLIEAESPGGLVEALRSFYKNRKNMKKYQVAANDYFNTYMSQDVIAKRLIQIVNYELN